MPSRKPADLSRRERQIMDVIYRLGRASAAEVQREMPDPPSYSAVRAQLRILEDKGQLKHEEDGAKYIYLPARPRGRAARSALRRVMQTFFGGSVEKTVAALISESESNLDDQQLDRLADLIDKARREKE